MSNHLNAALAVGIILLLAAYPRDGDAVTHFVAYQCKQGLIEQIIKLLTPRIYDETLRNF